MTDNMTPELTLDPNPAAAAVYKAANGVFNNNAPGNNKGNKRNRKHCLHRHAQPAG